MKTKHTPGPWSCFEGNATSMFVDDDFGIDGGRDYYLAEITHGDPDELAANAKLIAQAPALLADLIEAAKTLRRYETLHRAKGTDESTAKAEVNAALASRFESTIAKATA